MKSFVSRSVVLPGRRSLSALTFNKFGSPADVLKFSSAKIDLPSPAQGELKITVKASQVLPEDIRAVKGVSFINKTVNTAGTTAVGVVSSVPNGETDFAVNDSVFILGNGLWRGEANVAKINVAKLAQISSDDAATLPSFLTAWGILKNFTNLKAGDVVVQSSGDSSIGHAISQIGKALGVTVLSPTKDELKDPKFVANMKPQKSSIKLVVSDVSGRTSLDLTRIVVDGGVSVFYNGRVENLEESVGVDVPAASNIYKGVSVCGFDLATWHATDATSFKQAIASVTALGNEKKINLKPKVYASSDFLKAIADVESSNAAVVMKF